MTESLAEQRAAIGLRTPSFEQKQRVWQDVRSPTAGITSGYRPLPSGKKAHAADARGVAVSGGWRAGKSLSSGMEGVTWLPFADLIWLIARDYDLTRQEFIYLSEAGISTGLVNSGGVQLPLNKYQPCALRAITGCVVETRTLADFRKLAAKPPDLVIVCEPGLIDNLGMVMELLWGRVSERRGCIWMAGTSDEASEEWYELWESWNERANPWGGKAFSIPTWQNRHRFPQGRNEQEFLRYAEAYGEEALMAHYGGIPASPRNLVLRGYWNRGIHVNDAVEFNPGRPTEIAIDPNYALGQRYAVEVIQWDDSTGNIFLVDEVAAEAKTHDEVIQLCEDKPWWPHVQGGVIDPYTSSPGGEGTVYGSPAPVSYWNKHIHDMRMDFRPRVATTVQALKEALSLRPDGTPRLLVSPKCERFIYEALRWRQGRNGQPEKTMCDATKAVGYWLVDHLTGERMEIAHREDDNIVVARDWQIA